MTKMYNQSFCGWESYPHTYLTCQSRTVTLPCCRLHVLICIVWRGATKRRETCDCSHSLLPICCAGAAQFKGLIAAASSRVRSNKGVTPQISLFYTKTRSTSACDETHKNLIQRGKGFTGSGNRTGDPSYKRLAHRVAALHDPPFLCS